MDRNGVVWQQFEVCERHLLVTVPGWHEDGPFVEQDHGLFGLSDRWIAIATDTDIGEIELALKLRTERCAISSDAQDVFEFVWYAPDTPNDWDRPMIRDPEDESVLFLPLPQLGRHYLVQVEAWNRRLDSLQAREGLPLERLLLSFLPVNEDAVGGAPMLHRGGSAVAATWH